MKSFSRASVLMSLAVLGSFAITAHGQQLLPTYPGYKEYQAAQQIRGAQPLFKSGQITVTWTDDGKGFNYNWDGKAYHFDVASGKATTTGDAPPETAPATTPGRGGDEPLGPYLVDSEDEDMQEAPGGAAGGGAGAARGAGRAGGRAGAGAGRAAGGRAGGAAPQGRGGRGGGGIPGGAGGISGLNGTGRQLSTAATSPDGRFNAAYKDFNVFLTEGTAETAITTDGNAKDRVRSGKATIVYGEDLGQGTGMWWSPNSKKLAFYRFDEKEVKDYYLIDRQVPQYNSIVVDPYPKAGTISPVVEVLMYDVDTKKTTKMDIRSGKAFAEDVLGYYAYNFYWTRDSKELVFNRLNRKQNTVEICAADPETGKVRTIIHEEHLAASVDYRPGWEFLPDMNRFILTSERNGFKNYYLYDMSGKQLATLTNHQFEVAGLLKIDEPNNTLYYMARDGDNHMKLQLHRVKLDGTGDVRLTDPAWNHTITIAPDNQSFIDVYQNHDTPPATRVIDATGKVVAELAKGNIDRMKQINLKPPELFTFKSFDGTAELHGILNYPTNFDPNKKYPVLLSVYGGPNTVGARETFQAPNQQAEYGFLVVTTDARSMNTRGRKFSDPFYGHLGIVEMDDQAASVAELAKRPYVNKDRAGVYGTSYGGTSAATLLMRYPNIFRAASSSSPVTDYRNYNCVYAERFNGLVSENKAGYDAAMVMTYVPNLQGRLLLYYGTADNNVHVSNMMQLITALQRAGKSFEVQVGPDMGHTGVNPQRMMEFFIENLVMK